MTKENELDAKIAILFELDKPKDKPLISDEQQIAEFERAESARLLEEACQIFLTREREFQKIAEHPRVATDIQMNCLWWDRLASPSYLIVLPRLFALWGFLTGPIAAL